MPRSFSSATAEQVVAAVEAVLANGKPTESEFVAEFCDIPSSQAEAALRLATDLGLLTSSSPGFQIANPLCRVLCSPRQVHRAAALRVVLDSYEPFVVFRDRLPANPVASTAAQQTKVLLDLDAHREAVKDTLISLGTFSQALIEEGGGLYRIADQSLDHKLEALAEACSDAAAAEARIRAQLGSETAARVSRDEVIVPLADGLRRAVADDQEGAVQFAGNAVESYLSALGGRLGVQMANAPGINAKVEKLTTQGTIPKKLGHVGKYLGHIRNAADHGVDADIGVPWTIRRATGVEYVFVSCSFIAACDLRERSGPFEI
jgi:hypothetical protein